MLTCVVSAVLAVMATVPAVRFLQAVREVVIAVVIAAIGALATIGFEPVVTVARFEYVTLGLALLGVFALVYRLGAGLHGLGRRGVVIVLIGTGAARADPGVRRAAAPLRHPGPGRPACSTPWSWSRDNLGAFPRPLESVLGIPALAWGVPHAGPAPPGLVGLRVRRRRDRAGRERAGQPGRHAARERALACSYGVVVGLVIGFVVIRLDLALTGPRGRRGRRAEEAGALRPEPARTRALL